MKMLNLQKKINSIYVNSIKNDTHMPTNNNVIKSGNYNSYAFESASLTNLVTV
jgi:hypothetical protein